MPEFRPILEFENVIQNVYAIHLRKQLINDSVGFQLVDLNDTVNYPHQLSSGSIIIHNLFVNAFAEGTAAPVTISIGTLASVATITGIFRSVLTNSSYLSPVQPGISISRDYGINGLQTNSITAQDEDLSYFGEDKTIYSPAFPSGTTSKQFQVGDLVMLADTGSQADVSINVTLTYSVM
jgi:hypothetical protein